MTINFHGELDILKSELANIAEARKVDGAEINKIQTSLKSVSKDLAKSSDVQDSIDKRLSKLDNTTNKNLERITRLEQSNVKLCEDMKLLEERERRRSLNTRPKALVNLGSETGQLENRSSRTGAGNSSGSVRRLTYAENVGKVSANGSNTLSLLRELRHSEEASREREWRVENRRNEREREPRVEDRRRNRSWNIDLFSEARRRIGLFPVRARHILDFHEGNYSISPEDIPQLHDLRLLAGKEFLKKELKWTEEVEMETHWSSERNIL